MGGGEQLESFHLLGGTENFKWSDRCVKSSRVSKEVATQSGLKLGMGHAAFTTTLGKPTSADKQTLRYDFQSRRRMTPEEKRFVEEVHKTKVEDAYEFVEIRSSIIARFSESGLSSLRINHMESY